jgi:uncharacterized OB-fold protein
MRCGQSCAAIPIGQRVPCVIAIAELDVIDIARSNPPRIVANIVDAAQDARRIGRPVAVAWQRMSGMVSVPRYRLL